MANQSKRLAKRNAEKIASCRDCGITEMQLLVANLKHSSCPEAIAIEHDHIPIESLPSLPLPHCDAEECLCLWTAALPKDYDPDAVPTGEPLKLTLCGDCHHPIAPDAETCANCGRSYLTAFGRVASFFKKLFR